MREVVVREIRPVLTRLYAALAPYDEDELRAVLRDDAFVFSALADGVCVSADEVVADLRRWSESLAAAGATIEVTESVSGSSPSGHGGWVFDRLSVCGTEIRVTALLVREESWRIAAAYWSVPYPTQEQQDQDKHDGRLEPGVELEESLTGEAPDLARSLAAALAAPASLPALLSDDFDHVSLGSVTAEVFVGMQGRAVWSEFVQFVTAFSLRGPVRGATYGDVGWLAANIQIGEPATPYRFFYVWARDDDGWHIRISHDAVSRDPLAAARAAGAAGA